MVLSREWCKPWGSVVALALTRVMGQKRLSIPLETQVASCHDQDDALVRWDAVTCGNEQNARDTRLMEVVAPQRKVAFHKCGGTGANPNEA